MSNIVKTLWTHKKKAIVFAGAIAWGTNYALDKRRIFNIMNQLCLEAKALGDQSVPVGQPLRKAIVILNYGAHKSKGRKLYENYAAPLLNLAGIQVTIYATDETNKLRDYLDHLEPTDAILFAGGDTTVYECIQAYFSLEKPELSRTPVGILPLGYSNVVYNALRPSNVDEVLKIADAAMAAVKGICVPNDVLEIKIGESEEKKFAISGIQWGALSEAERKLPKYWYLGPIAPIFTYSLQTIKNAMSSVSAAIQYVNACPGCTKCEELVVYAAVDTPRRWWQSVIPRKKIDVSVMPDRRPSEIINEDCGVIHDDAITTQDLHLLTQNVLHFHNDTKSLLVTYRKDKEDSFLRRTNERSRLLNKVNKTTDPQHYGRRLLSEVRIIPTENDLKRHPSVEIDGHTVDVTGPLYAKIHSKKLFLFGQEPA